MGGLTVKLQILTTHDQIATSHQKIRSRYVDPWNFPDCLIEAQKCTTGFKQCDVCDDCAPKSVDHLECTVYCDECWRAYFDVFVDTHSSGGQILSILEKVLFLLYRKSVHNCYRRPQNLQI